jgi:capsular exopolysaccharide synthesis family protein
MDTAETQESGTTFASDVRSVVETLREKLWLILALAAIGGGLGYFYAQRSPKVYSSQVTVQVENEEQKILKIEGVTSDNLKSQEVLSTIEQSLISPELLLRVIERNDLATSADFLPEVARPATVNQLREVLGKRVAARVRRGTRLIDVQIEDQNPAMAQKIAQLLVKEFEMQGFEGRLAASQSAHEFLSSEAEKLKARLAKSEQALQEYKEQHPGMSLEDKQDITAEKMKELNQRLNEAKSERLKLENDSEMLKRLAGQPVERLLTVPSIAAFPAVVEAKRAIAEKETAFAALKRRYLSEHPNYKQAEGELMELRAGLDRAIQRGAEVVASSHAAAVETEKRMAEALKEQGLDSLGLSKIAIPYNALLRDVEADRTLYESVLTRLKETDLTKGVTQSPIRVVSRPLLPERPIKPNKPRIIAASVFAGLAFGLGLATLLRLFDGSLKTSDEAERRLGLRPLGVIPECAEMRSRSEEPLLSAHPHSPAAEAFRALRTSLALLGKGDTHPKTFLITSALPGDGKSSCAINCAMAFAQQGLRTLLIDADIRIPTLATTFFGSEDERGLTDVLTHQMHLAEAIRDPGLPHLYVLCAGTRTSTPAEVLGNGEFSRIVARARSDFDRVVIDSAPVHAVPDTQMLAGHIEATLLVVKAGRTPAQAAQRAVRKLTEAGAKPAGFIFNRVPPRGLEYYDQRYSLAGYGPRPTREKPAPRPYAGAASPHAAPTSAEQKAAG